MSPHTMQHPLNPAEILERIEKHRAERLPRLERYWRYYRNEPASAHPHQSVTHRLPQMEGLPTRLKGLTPDGGLNSPNPSREIVIENDIAWRLHTIVDFLFGRPVSLKSRHRNPRRASEIELLVDQTLEANGGLPLLLDMALMGSIYGFADLVVRPGITSGSLPTMELVDPSRVIPVLNPHDFRQLDAYIICNPFEPQQTATSRLQTLAERLLGRNRNKVSLAPAHIEVWTHHSLAHYQLEQGKLQLIQEQVNAMGHIPVVHVQNLPQPFHYEGISEVEPLIPLQDELNTRLSDRANRVTFQSFKMYLGKGVENFTEKPVGPGQMWATDNPDANIVEFGGDAASPSEDRHIEELRDALDKASGVNAVAAGILKDKVGNLTSENALRIVMLGLMIKTERKRMTYGGGLLKLAEQILRVADHQKLLRTSPDERLFRIDWPNSILDDEKQQLENAMTKIQLGVPANEVLAELGYVGMNPTQ